MPLPITDDHLELAEVAAFLPPTPGGAPRPGPSSTCPTSPSPRRGRTSPGSAGSGCTCPKSTAARGSGPPNSPWCLRRWAPRSRRPRSSPAFSRRAILVCGRAAGQLLPGARRRLQIRAVSLAVVDGPSSTTSCSAPASPTSSSSRPATTSRARAVRRHRDRRDARHDPAGGHRVTARARPDPRWGCCPPRRLARTLAAAEAAGSRRGARHGRRVREAAGAVRPFDRHVPGGEAPLRRHARRGRAGHRRRRDAARSEPDARAELPRRGRRGGRWPSPRAAVRQGTSSCTAASASPGSTTPTSTCAGPARSTRRGLRLNVADHALDAASEGAGVVLGYKLVASHDIGLGRPAAPSGRKSRCRGAPLLRLPQGR